MTKRMCNPSEILGVGSLVKPTQNILVTPRQRLGHFVQSVLNSSVGGQGWQRAGSAGIHCASEAVRQKQTNKNDSRLPLHSDSKAPVTSDFILET